jgi:hypothetical protein
MRQRTNETTVPRVAETSCLFAIAIVFDTRRPLPAVVVSRKRQLAFPHQCAL